MTETIEVKVDESKFEHLYVSRVQLGVDRRTDTRKTCVWNGSDFMLKT